MGWRGGCLAGGLGRSTVCYYCLGGCSALVVCARRSRLAWGVGAGAGSYVSPWAPPCPRVPRGAWSGLSRPGVPSLRLPVRHSMRCVRSAGPVWLPFGSAPRVHCVCVRSCSRGVRASPPLRVLVARALHAVPVQGAGRAVPGGSCPSAFPAAVPCSAYLARGGVARSLPPLALLGVARPPAGRPAFVCWLFTLWGRHEGTRGGRLSPGCGASGVGRSPTPDRPSFGACSRDPLPGGCGCGECRRGVPSPKPLRALLRAGFARCGGDTRAPGLGRLLPWCGASRVGRSPVRDRPSSGACGRGPLPTGCGCGGCGRGDLSPYPQRALLRAGLARCGGCTRVPGGGRLLPGCGASGVQRSCTPDCPSFGACGRGPLPTGCGCGGCGRGDPSPTPRRAPLRAGFPCCGGATRAPRGGASCLCVGRPGLGALPPPTARLLGRAARGPLPTGCGCGV